MVGIRECVKPPVRCMVSRTQLRLNHERITDPARTRTLTPVLVGLMAMGLGATNDAMAQGYSTDIELVRPVFSHKGLPGIDTPLMSAQPTLRAGFMYQYERDPVILYQFGEEVGGEGNGAVKDRNAVALGVSYDFTPIVGARLILPFAMHGGSDVPESRRMASEWRTCPRRALPRLGRRLQPRRPRRLHRSDRYERVVPRRGRAPTGAGVLAMFESGPLSVLFDANAMTRTKEELAEDWTNGSHSL